MINTNNAPASTCRIYSFPTVLRVGQEVAATPLGSGAATKPFEYVRCFWGEILRGSKSEIQRYGIAVGQAFPGEPHGPKRRLHTTDPRGFKTEISNWYGEGTYAVSITYPWAKDYGENPHTLLEPYAAGVQKRDCRWYDEFIGTAESLIAAGLMQPGHFPGDPGMGSSHVSIENGVPLLNAKGRQKKEGMPRISVVKVGKKFSLHIPVSRELVRARRDRDDAIDQARQMQLESIPKPAPLRHLRLCEVK